MELLPFFLILCMATCGMCVGTKSLQRATFDVLNYGAVGNGRTDDSSAFMKAWWAACKGQSREALLIIPSKTFLLHPVKFSGPCKAPRISVKVSGKLVAPRDKKAFKSNYWVLFNQVKGLVVAGNGVFDGQGSAWWPEPFVGFRPSALKFYECPGMVLAGTTHINSQKQHIVLTKCDNALITKINVIAPQNSPNTDGIDLATSKHVRIWNSHISTGDDCIAITAGCSNIRINGLTCGPSHGISIGGLGAPDKPDESVEDVIVNNCTFKGPGIAVRLKSSQGGRGHISHVTYDDIIVEGVGLPIAIDQYYCPRGGCRKQAAAIRINDVTFSRIRGTYTLDEAMSLLCSQTTPCTGVVLNGIDLRPVNPNKVALTKCFNLKAIASNVKPALTCPH